MGQLHSTAVQPHLGSLLAAGAVSKARIPGLALVAAVVLLLVGQLSSLLRLLLGVVGAENTPNKKYTE
jgi:hypothetical protein